MKLFPRCFQKVSQHVAPYPPTQSGSQTPFVKPTSVPLYAKLAVREKQKMCAGLSRTKVVTPFQQKNGSLVNKFRAELKTADLHTEELSQRVARYIIYNGYFIDEPPDEEYRFEENNSSNFFLTLEIKLSQILKSDREAKLKNGPTSIWGNFINLDESFQDPYAILFKHEASGLHAELKLFLGEGKDEPCVPVLYFYGLNDVHRSQKRKACITNFTRPEAAPEIMHAGVELTRALSSLLEQCNSTHGTLKLGPLVVGGQSMGGAIATVAGVVNNLESFSINGMSLGTAAQKWCNSSIKNASDPLAAARKSLQIVEEGDPIADHCAPRMLKRLSQWLFQCFTRPPAKFGLKVKFPKGKHDTSKLKQSIPRLPIRQYHGHAPQPFIDRPVKSGVRQILLEGIRDTSLSKRFCSIIPSQSHARNRVNEGRRAPPQFISVSPVSTPQVSECNETTDEINPDNEIASEVALKKVHDSITNRLTQRSKWQKVYGGYDPTLCNQTRMTNRKAPFQASPPGMRHPSTRLSRRPV